MTTEEADLLALVRRLRDGMRAWGTDEDGVHYAAWDAYADACEALGEARPLPESPVEAPEPLYYIRDMTAQGDFALWWRDQRCGYTTALRHAGLYTEVEAKQIERIRGTDCAYPRAVVEALGVSVVSPSAINEVPHQLWSKP